MTDFETRPLPNFHHSANWYTMSERTPDVGPSSSTRNRSSSSFSSTNSRRRSAIPNPPTGPPPDLPVPSLPSVSENLTPFVDYGLDEDEIQSHAQDDSFYLSDARLNPFQRPSASSQLTAVAQFSQSRLNSNPIAPHSANLSDSPPRSLLPRNTSPNPPASPPQQPLPPNTAEDTVVDRNLLAPPENQERSGSKKPSSRRALTQALELARKAVQLDSTNDDPYGAIQAYGQSVTLLKEVMERVRRGEDSTEHRQKNGRRRSVVAQEEEIRRLKTIHDTYADRMSILSLIYSIPTAVPLVDAESPTRPDTEPMSPPAQLAISRENGLQHYDDINEESYLSISPPANSPPMMSSGRVPPTSFNEGRKSLSQESQPTSARLSRQAPPTSRLRSSSNLPPRPPAPSNSPPSTPPISTNARVHSDFNPPSPRLAVPEDGKRSRANSIGHSRTGSGSRLEALKEEPDPVTARSQHQHQPDVDDGYRQPHANGTIRHSPPLPAIPSPIHSEQDFNVTPRIPITGDAQQTIDGPPPSAYNNPRSRGGSTMSDPTGSRARQQLISESTANGTISQRREKNKSTASVIAEDIPGPTSEGMARRYTSGALSPLSQATGRSRSSSFPVRPSVPIPGLPSNLDSRHPLPTQNSAQNAVHSNNAGATANTPTSTTSQPRRPSSSVRHSPQPPPRALHSSFQPPFALQTLNLVPAPPVLPGQLPTTPTSPLPPGPPIDPLRKPYHLMLLLNHTMTSKSGGYITRKLHIPYDVWSQGGAKLSNLPEKIKVLEVLCEGLRDLQMASVEFAGPMGVARGMGMGVGSITKKDGEAWVAKVEEFSMVCDSIVANFSKKLGVGEGFVVKKSSGVTSWGGKLSRRLDKFTAGKNLDSPTLYVQSLQHLFTLVQLLDEHTMALNAQPMSPVYASLPTEICMALEPKLRRSSEFFARVVLTFVIRDLSMLLDKYAKKGEKWLAE